MAAAAMLYSTPAQACSFASPDPKDVPIAKWVASVDQIVLARVSGAKERRVSMLDDDYDRNISPSGTHEFTLETIETIKGAPPAKFSLNGQFAGSGEYEDSATAQRHTRAGLFWLYFSPEGGGANAACQWSPRLAFGQEYLIFRNKNGNLERWFGRAVQNIPSRDDEWLLAVKRLARDPKRKYGRAATLPQVLASATLVIETVTEKCWPVPPAPTPPGPEPKTASELTGHRIVRQLWGKKLEHDGGLDRAMWPDFTKCREGEKRVVVVFGDDASGIQVIRFRADDGKVNFAGLANGTDEGLVETDSHYGLWYAQVALPPKLVWSVDELAVALKKRASGEDEVTNGFQR